MTSYSQFGEDKYVASLFDNTFRGVAVDVGAGNGIFLSNTYAFELAGWTCICIEPNPNFLNQLRSYRKLVLPYAVGKGEYNAPFTSYKIRGTYEACSALQPSAEVVEEFRRSGQIESEETFTVCVKPLDTLLYQVGATRLDYLSIDVEGGEWDVLSGFSLDIWEPKVIVVEQWAHAPDGRIKDLLEAHRYEKLARLGDTNDVWRRRE